MERLPLMMLGIYTNIAYANPTIHSFLDFICIPSCKWIVHKIIKSILDTHIERLQFTSAASRYKDLIILLLDWSFSNTVLHRWAATHQRWPRQVGLQVGLVHSSYPQRTEWWVLDHCPFNAPVTVTMRHVPLVRKRHFWVASCGFALINQLGWEKPARCCSCE